MTALRDKGHDVSWASQICSSQPDEVVLAIATSEGHIVITVDKDYGDLTVRDGHAAVGIVISQVDRFPGGIAQAIDILCERIEALGSSLTGSLTVIDFERVRQRALPPIDPVAS